MIDTPLSKALLDDDDLIAVVRGHIYIESRLNRLIDIILPFPERLSDTRFSWPQKVDLALSMGLKKQFGPPLRKLGSIRNKFAHNAEAKLVKKDITDLLGTLHEEERQLLDASLKETDIQNLGKSERKFTDMGVRDQFVLLAIVMDSMLVVAISSLTGEDVGSIR